MDLNRSQNLEVNKERILRFIEVNGPSLPIHLSNHLKIDSMLSSAFLSDLLSDNEIKISNMRVGNSPLYFIRGQEFQLEKFSTFLSGKEKEAFYILKEHGVLRDDWLFPAIRVALRSIKDFAFPFEKDDYLYWRYIKINEDSAIEMIDSGKVNFNQISKIQQISKVQNLISKSPVQTIEIQENSQVESENAVQEVLKVSVENNESIKENLNNNEVTKENFKVEDTILQTSIEPEVFSAASSMSVTIPTVIDDQGVIIDLVDNRFNLNNVNLVNENKLEEQEFKEQRKKREKLKPEFVLNVESLLRENNFEILNSLIVKKKDYISFVKLINEEYLCIAKDKKIISEVDIISLLKLGKKEKKKIVFICKGQPNKKAEDWLDYLSEFIQVKKLI
ncbi:MAG TPA: hypothetical protein P5277_04150 [Candidatus Paceibacterota bacterium]|nr:hypothetical protein [Candidatus Paceibacterota bacterium]